MSSAVRCLYDKEVRVGGRSQTSGLRVREAAMSGTIRYRPTLCHVSPLWLGPASVLSGRILLLRGIITVALYRRAPADSPGRSDLKIHFFIESGLKMIQFKIQFKTKSRIFIQQNIHSIESRIFNRIIHSQKMRKIIQNSNIRPKYGFEALLRPLYR